LNIYLPVSNVGKDRGIDDSDSIAFFTTGKTGEVGDN